MVRYMGKDEIEVVDMIGTVRVGNARHGLRKEPRFSHARPLFSMAKVKTGDSG